MFIKFADYHHKNALSHSNLEKGPPVTFLKHGRLNLLSVYDVLKYIWHVYKNLVNERWDFYLHGLISKVL